MHTNQINSFLAVSKTLNFTNAARQLGVPQSTISRQISDLESQLGVRLFYRTRRDVRLTDEGRIFLPYAQEIADAVRKGSFAVRQIHEGAAGRLNIAVTDVSQPFLSGVLADFHTKYPEITVDLTTLSCGESLTDDAEMPYDICFLYREMLPDPDSFEYTRTHQTPIGLLRRRVREKAGRSPVSFPDSEELAAQNFILLSEEADPILYMQAMNYCRSHRFTPRVVNTFDDPRTVLLSVDAGLGVSFLPASLIWRMGGGAFGQVQFLPLPDDGYLLDCIAAWKPSLLNPAASLFLDILRGGDEPA